MHQRLSEPDAGLHEPIAAIATHESSRLDITLAVVFGIAIGVLACAGIALTHPAPVFRCAVQGVPA